MATHVNVVERVVGEWKLAPHRPTVLPRQRRQLVWRHTGDGQFVPECAQCRPTGVTGKAPIELMHELGVWHELLHPSGGRF